MTAAFFSRISTTVLLRKHAGIAPMCIVLHPRLADSGSPPTCRRASGQRNSLPAASLFNALNPFNRLNAAPMAMKAPPTSELPFSSWLRYSGPVEEVYTDLRLWVSIGVTE